MSEQTQDGTKTSAPEGGYHPLLDLIVPAMILILSVAYAFSLRNIVDPELNLVFLRPIFAIIWVLLVIVGVRDVWPILRALFRGQIRRSTSKVPLRGRFRPGTEGGAALVVVATFIYALVALQGDWVFIVSTFIYLVVASYLIGERKPIALLAQGVLGTAGIYLVMGVLLGVRF
jgi:hypothetical protein